MSSIPEVPEASDAAPAIGEYGQGDVATSVVSMSRRHAEGHDAEYLEWHMLDHLPEQYRLPGLRLGQRWVSTPACRQARIVSEAPYADVDHIVQYLFAEPVGVGLDRFFPLGAALRRIGRMPMALPRVQVGGWELVDTRAAPRVLVGAAVVPWRPALGVFVLVERNVSPPGTGGDGLDRLVDVPGVAGAWCWAGAAPRHERLDSTAGLGLTVCYLDGLALEVAPALGPVLARRWAEGKLLPLLAAPFELVTPGQWDRHRP